MEKDARIYVSGGDTLIGSAIMHVLQQQGFTNTIGHPGDEPDLTDLVQVEHFFSQIAPEYVFMAAGKSGGIKANQKYPAELMLNNLLIECHIIDCAFRHKVNKLLFLASSCSYPKHSPQPIKEEYLLTGPLEPTNEAYAIAKIAGIKLCQGYRQQYGVNFIIGIPCNIFGPKDNFDPIDSHVIPALIRKMHEAKLKCAKYIELWGTGTPRRDFMYSEDLADACIFVMNNYNDAQPINISGGIAISIQELWELIKEVVSYSGELRYDRSKPNGMPLKVLDSSKLIEMGWEHQTPFRDAILSTYNWFLSAERK